MVTPSSGRPGDAWRADADDVARAEAEVDRWLGRDLPALDDVDRLVDRVIAGHGAVMATLERDLTGRMRDEFDTRRIIGTTSSPRIEAMREVTRSSAFASLERDLEAVTDVHPTIQRERQRRAAMVVGLEPTEFRPRTRQPVVTRGGVFYIAPRFEQARGIGDVSDARLIRAGFVTAEAFLNAPNEDLAELTGHSLDVIEAGKADFDLTRVPGIDRKAADLLRYVNVGVGRSATRTTWPPSWRVCATGTASGASPMPWRRWRP